MRRAIVVVAFIVLTSTSASAQVALLTGLGGSRGFGTECLSPNDDDSSAAIDLRPAFPSGLRFFGAMHTSVFVNTNGNITFSGPLGTYTPDPFPVAGQPMIAPYWGDVDIRGEGDCSGFLGDLGCSDPLENGVFWYLEPGLMVVTWDTVGYFGCHDDLKMSFQLILTAAPTCGGEGDFDVEFRFNRCEWTTGDASGGKGGFGGTPAQAGFDGGNLRDFVTIPGSFTDTIHEVMCNDSNVTEPGVWRFQIRSGTVVCPDAGRPCETDGVGACGIGATQCVGSGVECEDVVEPTPELCDAIDNDCDGSTDEGDNICGELARCQMGVCVPTCLDGACGEGQVCIDGDRCVDAGCEDVECPPGQRCADGVCADACAGVDCPGALSCRAGVCLELCDTIECDDCTACVDGACVERCSEDSCGVGQTCTESGHCVDTACLGVTCPAGEECVAGACQDVCIRAVCPRGQLCRDGACENEMHMTRPDAGPAPDAGSFDAGLPRADAGDTCPPGFICDDPGLRDEGCGCSASSAPSATWLVFAPVAWWLMRRRRR
jgi:uncharacterized protein (TIGR03382 family)